MYLIKRYKAYVTYAILGIVFCIPVVANAAEKTNYNSRMNIPLYNVITDTLLSMTPLVNGKKNDFLMQQVCALGDGKKTYDQVLNTLEANGLSIGTLKEAHEIRALLQQNNTANQQTACAAWIASSLYDIITTSTWYDVIKASEPTGEAEIYKGWMFWKKGKVTKPNLDREIRKLNVARFKNDVLIKMTIAQANAELYSLIASNLSGDVSKSWSYYQDDISAIIAYYASYYLNKIKVLRVKQNTSDFLLTNVTSNGFYVMNKQGVELLQEGGLSVLKVRGVEWLGNGKILGKEYFASINALD